MVKLNSGVFATLTLAPGGTPEQAGPQEVQSRMLWGLGLTEAIYAVLFS